MNLTKNIFTLLGLITLILINLHFSELKAQDSLVLKSTLKQLVKIKSIKNHSVTYQSYLDDNGIILNIEKSKIDYIRYNNGFLIHFNNDSISGNNDLYIKGMFDAQLYYQDYKISSTSTLIISLLSPIVGLIPATGTSLTTPKPYNLGFPDFNKFSYSSYQNGYLREAKKIKSKKVWKNWGIAFGVNLILVLAIASQ